MDRMDQKYYDDTTSISADVREVLRVVINVIMRYVKNNNIQP